MSDNTTTKNGVEFKACGCGCGEAVTSKATYRPGHDARHAGQVGKAAAAAALATNEPSKEALDPKHYQALSSHHLRDKAARVAMKILARENAKRLREQARANRSAVAQERLTQHAATKAASKDSEKIGTFKVGRWEYPARMTRAGKVERNTKRDGSGNWLPVDEPSRVTWA